ncbi:cation diffusion facilitator family transporter [Melioribacteraceae bacterium 4301-Me]|uniref:cation diffusion facilitator family transporter n=1 Tax=Pyranulibacter aquaticus TaxID=3163344 RepID=UPI00359651B4
MTTMTLNFVITAAQIIGGLISGSLSLISDALHNLSDGISIIITYVAIKLKQKDNSHKHTFGLKRAEILAAVINASALIIIYGFIFFEAISRFTEPKEIKPSLMMLVASIGLIANVIGTFLLKRDSVDSLNVRSSYLHLLSDTISSVAIIAGGIAIYLWKSYWVDPLLTILIGFYIVKESYEILSNAVHVLMEGAPPEISLHEIKKIVEAFQEVDDIHHIHLWTIGENDVHLEAHVNIADMKISQSDRLRKEIEKTLQNNLGINHITLQFECNQCLDEGLIGQHK